MPIIATIAFFVFLSVFLGLLITSVIQIIRGRPAVPPYVVMFVFAFLLFGSVAVNELGIEIGAKQDADTVRDLADVNADEPGEQDPEGQASEGEPANNSEPEGNGPGDDTEEPVSIKIMLDGKEVNPVDSLGNPAEPFIIGGTTYLPVRGIASALGLDVQWDAETNTVVLTSQEDEASNTGSSAQPNS